MPEETELRVNFLRSLNEALATRKKYSYHLQKLEDIPVVKACRIFQIIDEISTESPVSPSDPGNSDPKTDYYVQLTTIYLRLVHLESRTHESCTMNRQTKLLYYNTFSNLVKNTKKSEALDTLVQTIKGKQAHSDDKKLRKLLQNYKLIGQKLSLILREFKPELLQNFPSRTNTSPKLQAYHWVYRKENIEMLSRPIEVIEYERLVKVGYHANLIYSVEKLSLSQAMWMGNILPEFRPDLLCSYRKVLVIFPIDITVF